MSTSLGDLLLKAVQLLEPNEQEQVFTQLLTGAVAPLALAPASPALRTPPPEEMDLRRARFIEQLAAESGEPGRWKVLPIRLSEDGYDRLRAWCQANDFPMAVVVRGLIERFLAGSAVASSPS